MDLMVKVQVLIICILLKEAKTQLLNICPDLENIKPCSCDDSTGELIVKCQSIHNDDTFLRINSHLIGKEILSYEVTSSSINITAEGPFQNITAKELIIFFSTVHNFDLFAGLYGMRDTLQDLRFIVVEIKRWTYSSAEEFKKLKSFHMVMSCNLKFILPCLPRNLTYIFITGCVIKQTRSFSFVNFTNLVELSLTRNHLKSIERNIIPRPASHLVIYSLGENPLTYLPDDMFVDMPALRKIMLEKTLLNTLPYHIFKPIFKQLNVLQITHIPLICDCNAAWLLQREKILSNGATSISCHKPDSLKNRYLQTLMPIDMCFNCEEHLQNKTFYTTDKSPTIGYTTENVDNKTLEMTDSSNYTTWHIDDRFSELTTSFGEGELTTFASSNDEYTFLSNFHESSHEIIDRNEDNAKTTSHNVENSKVLMDISNNITDIGEDNYAITEITDEQL